MTSGTRPGRVPPQKKSDGPPPAPWGSFPLSEIVIALALISLIAGLFISPPRGAVMIVTGLVLGSLAGLELAVREHFAGYRSHTMLLSGAVGMALLGGLVLLGVSATAAVVAGLAAVGLGAWFFTRAFKRRSGGASFKLR